jgi:hypothetical protein
MTFWDAYREIRQGKKAKFSNFEAYWYYDSEKNVLMMHTKSGQDVNVQQPTLVDYVLNALLSTEWEIVQEGAES